MSSPGAPGGNERRSRHYAPRGAVLAPGDELGPICCSHWGQQLEPAKRPTMRCEDGESKTDVRIRVDEPDEENATACLRQLSSRRRRWLLIWK